MLLRCQSWECIAGYIQAHPSSNGSSPAAAVAGKSEQRHSDAGSSANKASDSDDIILSGNLEQLSQQLQSATAMFNSQSAPPTSRGPYGTAGGTGMANGMSHWQGICPSGGWAISVKSRRLNAGELASDDFQSCTSGATKAERISCMDCIIQIIICKCT